jgi:hypothetical protein
MLLSISMPSAERMMFGVPDDAGCQDITMVGGAPAGRA